MRKQRVHTYSCETLPSVSVVTLWTLALKVRFVFLCEWLTLLPDTLPLPQTEHTLLIVMEPPNADL